MALVKKRRFSVLCFVFDVSFQLQRRPKVTLNISVEDCFKCIVWKLHPEQSVNLSGCDEK